MTPNGNQMAPTEWAEMVRAALGKPEWADVVEALRRDLSAYGSNVNYEQYLPTEGVKVGDLVAIWAHQRMRAARVWKAGRTRVSAVYLAPSHVDEAARYGRALWPNNITGKPAAIIERKDPGAEG